MSDSGWGWVVSQMQTATFAGALGGLVRTLALNEFAVLKVAVSVSIGAISAAYLHPLALPLLRPTLGEINVQEAELRGFAGFIIGLGGVVVVGFIMDIWQARRRQASGERKE